jgi:hypothetical protein
MFRISAAIAVLTMIGTSAVGVSSASADSWGCSYDKCLAACGKAGGKFCGIYCDKQMNNKRMSKVCK